MAQKVFTRIEKKFRLTAEQYTEMLDFLHEHMRTDQFGRHTICSLYYDSPDDRMIINSVQKPVYKEKLRLRSYGIPQDDSRVFVEIKKKYNGVVNKRRIEMEYARAIDFLAGKYIPEQHPQIEKEIEWVMKFYEPVPKCMVAYDRIALFSDEHPDLRVTFDENIRCRGDELDLRLGSHGEHLLPDGEVIMEIKAAGAMPMWLVRKLSEMKIFKTSFSKYGTFYLRNIKKPEDGSNVQQYSR